MPDYFFTIEKPSEGVYKEKGSKFIARAYPVKEEEEIKTVLEELRKEYHDARHHCYAWALGADGERTRANDDGEPSGTAGRPISGQISSFGLTNILIVVIRYFGGTLLGVGGLINAYKTASRDALKNATIKKQYLYLVFGIRFNYSDMNNVMKILKEMKTEQFRQKFGISCSLIAKVKRSDKERFISSFEPFPDIEIIMPEQD